MQPTFVLDWQYHPDRAGYTVRALLTISGTAPQSSARVPLNISIVLDRSGSMAGEKLEAARDAATFMVRRLHPSDMISVVAFDGEVSTIAAPAMAAAQHGIADAIAAIRQKGNTNLSGGWMRGREFVGAGMVPASLNRIVLLTDGMANEGITDPAALIGLCATARAQGVSTSTIGFGEGYSEDLLKRMADAGSGDTWYIERADQAADVFQHEVAGLLSLCAQNVVVELRLDATVAGVSVRNDWPTMRVPTGVRLDLGDLYAVEPKQVLFECFVADVTTADTVATIGEVVLTGAVLQGDGSMDQLTISLPIAASLDQAGRTEPTIAHAVLLAHVAEVREASRRHRDGGEFARAAHDLRDAAAQCEAQQALHADLAPIADDLRAMAARFERQEVSESDIKYQSQRAYNARRGKRAYDAALSRPMDPDLQ